MAYKVEEVGLLVKRLQHRHHRAMTAELAELGISLVQWDTLRHLDRLPDASLHDLAQLTFQTDQSFGSLAVRMARSGLIERIEGPGRAVRHRLTPKGQELREAGAVRASKVLTESFAPLAPEQVQELGELLHQLLSD